MGNSEKLRKQAFNFKQLKGPSWEYFEVIREKLFGFRVPEGSTTPLLSQGGRVVDLRPSDCELPISSESR